MFPWLLAAVACSAPAADPPAVDGGADADPCTGLPAVSSAAEGVQPVLGDGAVVVYGEICDPSDARVPVFRWAVASVPSASTVDESDLVTYQDGERGEALLIPDMAGSYVLGVAAEDPEGSVSAPLYFVVTHAGDPAPVADCGDDREVGVGERVELDGTGSYDPLGRHLAFGWELVRVPPESTLTAEDLRDAATAVPWLVPDVAGGFVAALTVDNGVVSSDADYCLVVAG